ncbi:uncharacterized protein LOC115723833 [Cannabis sativa]|uniref:uncharacterized protein LOC115723833 n=1 Tax=Cannabis sativa TaxID=3483 RepID=UPI0029CA8C3C|nr:uncharacterized protein LOC115723833 [Cannabis sativa]
MSVFLLPLKICQSLESIMSDFRWQSSKSKKGVSWVSWKKLCKHKISGGLVFRDFRNYNLDLLGKQAWRLLTDESSLVCKVYKARYFPNGSFLTAALGNNPSFIWKSILEIKDIIKAGARMQIGNGQNTMITTDPWLLDLEQPDHGLILEIPLTNSNVVDCWNLIRDASCYYSLKSAYRFLQQEVDVDLQNNEFWKKTAVSTVAATDGDFKKWFQDVTQSGNAYTSTKILMIAWQIWLTRNDVLWNQRSKLAANVVFIAKSHFNQWYCAQQNQLESLLVHNNQGLIIEHWTKHVANMIKVNVDGAIFEANCSFGFGFIARDSNGLMLNVVSKSLPGHVTAEIAETFGSDNVKKLPSAFGLLVWDCKQLLAELGNVNLRFVKRSVDKVAHFIAQSACSLSARVFHFHDFPVELLDILRTNHKDEHEYANQPLVRMIGALGSKVQSQSSSNPP